MKLKWLVEFEIDEVWINDGFRLTNEVAQEMIDNAIPWGIPGENKGKVIKAPIEEEIQNLDPKTKQLIYDFDMIGYK